MYTFSNEIPFVAKHCKNFKTIGVLIFANNS